MAVGPVSYRQIAERVGMNAESVRRYMYGYAVPAEFIAAICREYGVSGSWLLLGLGTRTLAEHRLEAVRSATTQELLDVIAERVPPVLLVPPVMSVASEEPA